MAMSEFKIKALKPEAERYSVSDGQGFGLEVFWSERWPSGNPTAVMESRGRWPLARHAQGCPQTSGRIRRMLEHGRSPAVQKQAAEVALSETTTVYEFGERYFKEIVCRDVKYPSGIRRNLDKEIYTRLAQRT